MRTAAICPTCAVFYNAACIIYDGSLLEPTGIANGDPLDTILSKINNTFQAITGTGNPTANVKFVGELYIDTATPALWIGLVAGIPDWGYFGVISTTTTTSTTSTTTTAH